MKRFSLFLFALFALLMGVPPQAALAKAGDVVTNLSNLSNSKVYNIKSVRGICCIVQTIRASWLVAQVLASRMPVLPVPQPPHSSLPSTP